MGKKPVVKLRVYRGRKLSFDANGKVQNENQLVSLIHNTKQWTLFMANLLISGFCKVDVDSVWNDKGGGKYEKIKGEDIIAEVKQAFTPKVEVPQTFEQKQIADLTAKVDALTKGEVENTTASGDDVVDNNSDAATPPAADSQGAIDVKIKGLPELREEYEALAKKKDFNGWNAEQLMEKIAELKK